MQRKDDRTEAQQQTHTILVVGTDRFLSGWGAALGGLSYAAWACDSGVQADAMRQRIAGRTDMSRVRTVIDKPGNRYAPKAPCKHLHIYVADITLEEK